MFANVYWQLQLDFVCGPSRGAHHHIHGNMCARDDRWMIGGECGGQKTLTLHIHLWWMHSIICYVCCETLHSPQFVSAHFTASWPNCFAKQRCTRYTFNSLIAHSPTFLNGTMAEIGLPADGPNTEWKLSECVMNVCFWKKIFAAVEYTVDFDRCDVLCWRIVIVLAFQSKMNIRHAAGNEEFVIHMIEMEIFIRFLFCLQKIGNSIAVVDWNQFLSRKLSKNIRFLNY